jgi:hypothetical protein
LDKIANTKNEIYDIECDRRRLRVDMTDIGCMVTEEP